MRRLTVEPYLDHFLAVFRLQIHNRHLEFADGSVESGNVLVVFLLLGQELRRQLGQLFGFVRICLRETTRRFRAGRCVQFLVTLKLLEDPVGCWYGDRCFRERVRILPSSMGMIGTNLFDVKDVLNASLVHVEIMFAQNPIDFEGEIRD